MKKYLRLITLFFLFSILVFTGLFLSSCSFVQDLFGGSGGGGETINDVNINGTVDIGFSAGYRGNVIVGFIDGDLDPENPIPWADFEGSSQNVGTFEGSSVSFNFSFKDVPEGNYYLAAIIDTNGNGKLDLGEYGDPIEPNGFYPAPNADGPSPADFNKDLDGIGIEMYPGGIEEDFEDYSIDNWIPDDPAQWSLAYSDVFGSEAYELQRTKNNVKRNIYYDCVYNSDFDFYADVVQPVGTTGTSEKFGLLFRVQDPGNIASGYFSGYALEIDSSKNWFFNIYSYDGAVTIKSGNSSDINVPTTVNTLNVECHGSSYDIYINGYYIDTVYDSTYQGGYVGVFADDIDSGDPIDFDNILLSVLY